MRKRYIAVSLPALVGLLLAAFAYFAPNTGVTGTGAALLTLLGALGVTLGALLAAAPAVRGGLLGALVSLVAVGALLTALAAFFLMQYGCTIAMVLTFAGVIAAAVISWRDSQ